MNPGALPEHFFRHEYGRLVSLLSGRMGTKNLELIEDAVQAALMKAVETWRSGPLPENPSAWLYRVAFNQVVGDLRQRNRRRTILKKYTGTEFPLDSTDPELLSEEEISDGILTMMFFCCDPDVPVESQLVLALKTLCGFDVREIAGYLFTTEENVYKRLARARSLLRDKKGSEGRFSPDSARVSGVQRVLYALFSQGYLSTNLDLPIRNDLCEEAMRLTKILVDSSVGGTTETAALLALMSFHRARSSSRIDGSGGLVLLESQDRSLWDRDLIQQGLLWLERSASGDRYSRYHAEAAIAAEHCLAPSFSDTDWDKIVHHYDLLISVEPSALHELNRAVAIAEAKGPGAALHILENKMPPSWLGLSYSWSAVLADLHFRSGHSELGKQYYGRARETAPTPAIKRLLDLRMSSYLDDGIA